LDTVDGPDRIVQTGNLLTVDRRGHSDGQVLQPRASASKL
jgi:hypothetical protein